MWPIKRHWKPRARRQLLIVIAHYRNGSETAVSTLYPGELWHMVRICSEHNVPLDIWLAPVDENDPRAEMRRLTVEQYQSLPAVLEARGQIAQSRALLGLEVEA